MNYEHDNKKPDHLTENWEGKWKVFSWLEFVCAIPSVLFMITTVKENGLTNAAFQSWSSFTGEGDDYFVIMSGVMKHTHTYANIKREKEFCVNFVGKDHLDKCWKSIQEHHADADELLAAGFTPEASHAISPPRIKESFLKLECTYEWQKELVPDSHNITICGKVQHVSIDEAFAEATTREKYGQDHFVFNLHNPINPLSGEHLGGGVGIIQYVQEM